METSNQQNNEVTMALICVCLACKLLKKVDFYRPQTKFGAGNIFTPVCHSVHGGEGHVWLPGGGMHGCRGACMVVGGYAWLLGGCVVGRACIGYDEIRSMSGRYASYWNAFFSLLEAKQVICLTWLLKLLICPASILRVCVCL